MEWVGPLISGAAVTISGRRAKCLPPLISGGILCLVSLFAVCATTWC